MMTRTLVMAALAVACLAHAPARAGDGGTSEFLAWKAAHPPRDAKDDYERRMIEEGVIAWCESGVGDVCAHLNDGRIMEVDVSALRRRQRREAEGR